MASFWELPEDLLYEIIVILRPQDIISLGQTCRAFHAYTSRDDIWHHLALDLPLDIHGTVSDTSGVELRQKYVEALRLDANWRSPSSRIRNVSRIDSEGVVTRVDFAGSKWMLVLSSNSMTESTITVWNLESRYPLLHARLKFGYRVGDFAWSLNIIADSMNLVLLPERGRTDFVFTVRRVTLERTNTLQTEFETLCTLSWEDFFQSTAMLADAEAMFYQTQTCGTVVAAAYTYAEGGSTVFQVLLHDIVDGFLDVIRIRQPMEFIVWTWRLESQHLIAAGTQNLGSSVREVVQIYSISRRNDASKSVLVSQTASDPRSSQMGLSLSVHLPDIGKDLTSLCVYSTTTAGEAIITRHPLNYQYSNERVKATSYRFRIRSGMTMTDIAVGRNGRRAVWWQRQWENDQSALVKATFTTDEPDQPSQLTMSDMIPSNVAVPFDSDHCISVTIEEASGRVAVTLDSGDVYILEY